MKNLLSILFIAVLFSTKAHAQNYNNIINYFLDSTPANGIKIVTNLPFTSGTQMPTITIQGYNYGTGETIGLQIVYYVYNNGTTFYFPNATITSFGTYSPQVYLANENNKVVIFINDKPYYQRFTVSAFAQGMAADNIPASYQGWTVVDQALTGTNQTLLPYTNKFTGTVNMPGTGIWNATGNVGIGTVTPGAFMLAVNGNVHAKQVNVDLNGFPDYVFDKNYTLPPLTDVKAYIDKNHHLPEIPTEQQIEKDGLNLGEMNKLLVKKVEELTLYLIERDNKETEQEKINKDLIDRIGKLEQKLNTVSKQN
jgi:hypothetical protein